MWSNACQIHSTKDEGVGPGMELSVQYTNSDHEMRWFTITPRYIAVALNSFNSATTDGYFLRREKRLSFS